MILVIIIPIISLGLSSYNTSSKVMAKQYRELGEVIGNEVRYILEERIDNIERSANYISSSPSLVNLLDNPEEIHMMRDVLRRSLENYNLENIYFGTREGNMYIESIKESTNNNLNPLERDWYKSAVKKNDIVWSDVYLDEIAGVQAVTLSKPVYKGDEFLGVIGMDISLESFIEIMSKIKISEKGYPMLIDKNGVVIGHKDKSQLGKEFQPKEEAINLKSGTKLLEYNFVDKENGVEEKELIVLTNIEKTGWKTASILSLDPIVESKNSIIKNIIVVGLIACIAGVIASVIFGRDISVSINKVLEVLRRMEKGDLTSRIDIKGNDEFGEVRDSFNTMIVTLGFLIKNIKEVSVNLGEHSGNLAAISEEVSAASLEVSSTAEEIARGASEQASDTEKGVSIINKLSEELLELDNSSKEMLDLVDNIRKTSQESSQVVDELKEKTEMNNMSTDRVQQEIITLDERIGQVSNILSTIDTIAEQTNLLALNASIEAARAGEYGKGFAVVAEEIRKLAQESKESSNSIKDIISNVQAESKMTVDVVKDVKERSEDQAEAVYKVNESFDTISNLIEDIILKINNIGDQSDKMNKDRNSIVNSMQNISAVSEETAAASEEVTASIQQQTAATEDVANSANKLNELATTLSEEINIFKI